MTTPLQDALETKATELGSLAELARRLEISTGLLSGWMNKGVVPEYERIDRIATLLGRPREEVQGLWLQAYAAGREIVRIRQAERRKARLRRLGGGTAAALAALAFSGAVHAAPTLTAQDHSLNASTEKTSYRTLNRRKRVRTGSTRGRDLPVSNRPVGTSERPVRRRAPAAA